MGKQKNASGTSENYPALSWHSRMLAVHSHGLTLPLLTDFGHSEQPRTEPRPQSGASTAPRLPPPTSHTTITHSNYISNCWALISPQPAITAYSCKPNQGKPAYLHKSCNEKYNDFTNKTWIRTRICDKHFVSRRIENDFLSWRLFQAHLTQSVPLWWCAVSYTHQVISR